MDRLTVRCSVEAIKTFFTPLTNHRKEILLSSVFGNVFKISNFMNCTTILSFLVKSYESENKFLINGRRFKFTSLEMALILGLKVVGPETTLDFVSSSNSLKNRFLKNKVDKSSILYALSQEISDEDFLKLSLLYVLAVFLLPTYQYRVENRYLDLVDDLGRFNEFPWGQEVYNSLFKSLETTRRSVNKERPKERPMLHGCTVALQAWAYERFPNIGAERIQLQFPRVLTWFVVKYITSKKVGSMFEKAIEGFVRITLTDDELKVKVIQDIISRESLDDISQDGFIVEDAPVMGAEESCSEESNPLKSENARLKEENEQMAALIKNLTDEIDGLFFFGDGLKKVKEKEKETVEVNMIAGKRTRQTSCSRAAGSTPSSPTPFCSCSSSRQVLPTMASIADALTSMMAAHDAFRAEMLQSLSKLSSRVSGLESQSRSNGGTDAAVPTEHTTDESSSEDA